ncbi:MULTISPECIES: coenzyme F430 synthase [unclassified Methanoculleus]|uniref:coenzyme F430 synthase n=1 Tax=unclassified Methanoculleus TaxID=2619537 RepID=UPI0025D8A0F1|nr:MULTISPECIES: coenzyme F430 synthase [unclassified Methanoculleus]MCK9317280.1 coenzyme F430 synthase [Methanoculleus sp.]MDD2253140.1 coenzyme F430 synthase [Methanoculleus sp.]MDD2788409.1 coenzyme F430 synthase [Methanoculleus sp.]MDD3215840.1 coenzyme F430 synthase [Methanoculleus sp.]MDD4313725.1 coenzyme F430 synthase [Methanoculleus sp.]
MRVLVLDTIHGGADLAAALRDAGHEADEVDVYRGKTGISLEEALVRTYDLVTAPVHLDPDHLLLRRHGPAVSHHEAVKWVLDERLPHPFIEITGARGKTTTAHALAALLPGPGILHTSTGTYRYPERERLWKRSITPASLIAAVREAERIGGWLVAEESLGVTGAGDVAVLTSPEDYPVAAGKKHAITEKCRLLSRARRIVLPDGIDLPGGVMADEVVSFEGRVCRYAGFGVAGTFTNPLCTLAGYRTPLALAAATACLLGIDPSPLGRFSALPGRMAARWEGGLLILDNANSGTNAATTIEAARYARELAGGAPLTLVIGEEARAICEGFSTEDIRRTVTAVGPTATVYVGEGQAATTLEAGLDAARRITPAGAIVLAVKTWR